jgi:hypothetical protein
MNFEKTCRQIKLLKNRAEELENNSEFTQIIYERIVTICSFLRRGYPKHLSCSEDQSIIQGIAGIGTDGLRENEYPASEIEIMVTHNYIKAYVTAYFRHEVDWSYTFEFPINEVEFKQYIDQLEREANERENKIVEKQKQTELDQIEKEKAIYKRLKEKYEI